QVRNVVLACANHESALRRFPQGAAYNWNAGDDSNGLSWNVFVLPYMEDGVVSDQLTDMYADAQANDQQINVYDDELERLNQVGIGIYTCPSDSGAVDKWNKDYQAASYAGVMGSAVSRGAAKYIVTGGGGSMSIDGILFPLSEVRPRRITDGLSKTFIVGERWYQLRVWTAGVYFIGGGWTVQQPDEPAENSFVSACKNISGAYPLNAELDQVGYYVSHDNRYDRPNMPAGAPQTIPFNSIPFGSMHPGGANFAHADGSVVFVNDGVSGDVMEALASRNGGEIDHRID
ncbi:MAG: DUF1559 domain-containing protein, partial [Planctomycetota bacterium]